MTNAARAEKSFDLRKPFMDALLHLNPINTKKADVLIMSGDDPVKTLVGCITEDNRAK